MRIYVSHASSFDYRAELYRPLQASPLAAEHELILPHRRDAEPRFSKQTIAGCDLMLAETSFPSTGQGIELGWASADDIPIVCLHRQEPSVSLRLVARQFLAYSLPDDLKGLSCGEYQLHFAD